MLDCYVHMVGTSLSWFLATSDCDSLKLCVCTKHSDCTTDHTQLCVCTKHSDCTTDHTSMSTTILREIIAIRFSAEIISHTHTTHYYHYTLWQLHVKPFRFPFTQPHLHNTLHTGTRSPPTTLLLPTVRPTINCRLVLCAPPPCLNPFPSIPAFGLCCPTCPRRQICLHAHIHILYVILILHDIPNRAKTTSYKATTAHSSSHSWLQTCIMCSSYLPKPTSTSTRTVLSNMSR